MDRLSLLALIVVCLVANIVVLPLLNKRGVPRLKQCLMQRHVDPRVFSDACLKELTTLAEGPVMLPRELSLFQRRARYAENIDMLASNIALTVVGRNPYGSDERDPLIRVLRKHGILSQT